MNKTLSVLSKVPWDKVAKTVGVVGLGTASVLRAMKADETTSKLIVKVASKIAKKESGV